MLFLIVNMVNVDYGDEWTASGFINTCQLGFSFFWFVFVFQVLIEQVPIDLKNPYVNSGCWILTPYHDG